MHERYEHNAAPVQRTSVTTTESPKWLPWLILTAILSGIAVALAITMTILYSQNYRELEREYRLQRLETDEMNVRLELAGIPKHRNGDSP